MPPPEPPASAPSVALVLAAVWAFWPLALGGGTTYVSTHGTSMEPRFHTGDLAILRSADRYEVGRRRRLPQRVAGHRRHAPDRRHGRRPLRDPGRQQRLARRGPPDGGRGPRHALPARSRTAAQALAALRSPAVLAAAALAALAVLGAARATARPARCPVRAPPLRRPSTPRRPPSRCRPGRWPGRSRWSPAPSRCWPRPRGGVLLALPSTQTRRAHAAGDPAGHRSPTPAPPSPGPRTRTASSRPATPCGPSSPPT